MVTMKWWDDLWLNEGFASLLMYFAMDAIYPEWNVVSISKTKEHAMVVLWRSNIYHNTSSGDLVFISVYVIRCCKRGVSCDGQRRSNYVTSGVYSHSYTRRHRGILWFNLLQQSIYLFHLKFWFFFMTSNPLFISPQFDIHTKREKYQIIFCLEKVDFTPFHGATCWLGCSVRYCFPVDKLCTVCIYSLIREWLFCACSWGLSDGRIFKRDSG